MNLKNWARNNMSTYDDMYSVVRRYDGTSSVVVDSSIKGGYIAKDRYRDGSIHLHFTAEEPPTGVTYEYLGEVRGLERSTATLRRRIHRHAHGRRPAPDRQR